MKKYYISYYRDFGNTYNLYWAETSEQIAALPKNARKITRREAKRKCAEEKSARGHDPSFSGFASAVILPADYSGEKDWRDDPAHYRMNGCRAHLKSKPKRHFGDRDLTELFCVLVCFYWF